MHIANCKIKPGRNLNILISYLIIESESKKNAKMKRSVEPMYFPVSTNGNEKFVNFLTLIIK